MSLAHRWFLLIVVALCPTVAIVAAVWAWPATEAMRYAAADAPSPTPAPATPSPSQSPKPANNEPNTALVYNGANVQTLLGLPLQTSKGEGIGRVVDVIVDRSGAILAAIVDFGGFLGVGTRKIAVDWRMLHFPEKGALNRVIADLPLDQLHNAPIFKPGEPIVIMGAPAPPPPAGKASPTSTPSPSGAKP